MGTREAKDALYAELARMGKALSSGKRLELLDLLAQGERGVEALADAAELSVTNTSAHLQTLRRGGLVVSRKEGTSVRYRLADDAVGKTLIAFRELARQRLAEVDRAAQEYLGAAHVGEVMGELLTREELRRRLRRGDVVLIDVRPASEFAAGHIKGARSVPVDELAERIGELPSDKEVVAYCRGPFCVYSAQAVGILRGRGRRARQLVDGFPEWRMAGLPVQSDALKS